MKLNNLYRSILRYAGLDADDEGFISTVLDDRREPALLDGARLVLPLPQHLRAVNPKEKIIFHPLSENILRGESEVLVKLREVINIRLNFTFGIIGQSLLQLVASPEEHHKLDPDQSELLIAVKNVDETTIKNFIAVMIEGVRQNANRLFMNIFLKRGGTIDTKRYSRVGVVTFGLYEELMKDGNEVYGVKLRVKDKETFKQLYNFIFPNVSVPMFYSRGSDSDVAPFLDALMKSSMAVACRFNDILEQFEDFIDEGDSMVFDSEWVSDFENLSTLIPEIRRVPVQAGNEGSAPASEASTVVRPTLPLPSQQPQQPVYPNQQQQQHRPEIKETSRGLDFNSLKAVNPALAYGGNAMAAYTRPPGFMAPAPRDSLPSWAIPGGYGAGAPAYGAGQQSSPYFHHQQQQPYQQQTFYGTQANLNV